MKKTITLLAFGVLFFSIFLFSHRQEEQVLPVVLVDEGQSYYEIDVSDLGITTNNLPERFSNLSIYRIYPKFSKAYKERIEQKYYTIDQNKELVENCELMQERYLFLLDFYGFIHDKQKYQISGIPISKITISATEEEVETSLKQYSMKKLLKM